MTAAPLARRTTPPPLATTINPGPTEQIVRLWLIGYVALWLFEGALRKWIVPSLGDPLYFARDLLTIGALLVVMGKGVGRQRLVGLNIALAVSLVIAVVGGVQVISAKLPGPVYLIGLDVYVVPVLALGLVTVSTRRDVLLRDVTTIISLALPIQALLVMVQVTSPLESFVNRASEDSTVGFITTDDVVRGSGTFTSPFGLTTFSALAVAVVLARVLTPGARLRPMLLIQIASATVIVSLGGSRGAILGSVIVAVGALLFALATRGASLGKAVRVAGAVGAAYVAFEIVQRAFPSVLAAFSKRIDQASREENSLERVVNGAVGYWSRTDASSSWLGDGLGSHTLAGIAAGSPQQWVEVELTRWVADLGTVGLVLVLLRQAAGVLLLVGAARSSRRAVRPMALLATLAVFLPIVAGSVTAPGSQQAATVVSLACVWFAWPRPSDHEAAPVSADQVGAASN